MTTEPIPQSALDSDSRVPLAHRERCPGLPVPVAGIMSGMIALLGVSPWSGRFCARSSSLSGRSLTGLPHSLRYAIRTIPYMSAAQGLRCAWTGLSPDCRVNFFSQLVALFDLLS